MNERPATTIRWLVSLIALLVVTAPATASAQKSPVTVGSKKFTESVILGEILEGLVESTGRPASHRAQLGGTRVAWKALKQGEISVYPEYTGTIRQEIFAGRSLPGRESLRRALAADGVAMSKSLGFENTYALGMKRQQAERLGIETISDLKRHPDLTFGFSNEFTDRKDGWPGLREHYGFGERTVRGLDHDLAYRGLESGDVDVVDVYSTDAAIELHDLRILADDRGFFPTYTAVLLYRKSLRKKAPEAVRVLKSLEGKITARQMAGMNEAAKVDGRSEEAVAADFLERIFGYRMCVDVASIWQGVGARTFVHLFMVVVSMLAAVLVAIPLGVWAFRRERLGQGILAGVGILQTIPSLALLAVMIPLFGIGRWPAIAALFLYSLLPIVRNTYAGLNSIPEEILESARALGLEESSVLRLVELPMAMRSILAGLKIAVVINIGIATLGALIGAGGYGQPILTGIRRYEISLILEGAIPAAGLAVVAQLLFEGIERLVVPRGLRQGE